METNVMCLSQLLAENTESRRRCEQYSWMKYFNPDYTFSSYKFKKKMEKSMKEETSSTLGDEKKITPSVLRNELLCCMIKLHNSLYKVSAVEDDICGHYKGELAYY
jgi:hypothetical protein